MDTGGWLLDVLVIEGAWAVVPSRVVIDRGVEGSGNPSLRGGSRHMGPSRVRTRELECILRYCEYLRVQCDPRCAVHVGIWRIANMSKGQLDYEGRQTA